MVCQARSIKQPGLIHDKAKEVCQHTHSTRSVVGIGATKHVQLPISSESTGLVVLQWFNRVALAIAQLELRRPGRAGIPFYKLLTRSLMQAVAKQKGLHPTPDTAICS